MAEIRGIFDYIREALGEQISPIGSAYSKFLELPVDARRGLISQDFRQKVENMPTAPYTGDGNFQGVLGSTQAEKIDGYSGSDLTDYDISGENISNADKFVAETILGTGDILTQPDVIGKELVDIGSGLLQKATGEVTNQEQVDKANLVQESVASLFTPEGFNKSMYETGGAVALPVGGAYLGLKGAQLSKSLFNKGIQPGMSIKDISNERQLAPRDELGFYTKTEQLLLDLPQETNTPQDIRFYLQKRGVKRDEIDDIGLNKYLKDAEESGRRVTKQDLLNFVEKSKVNITQTSLLGATSGSRNILDNPYDDDAPTISRNYEYPEGVNYGAIRYWEVDEGMKDWYKDSHQPVMNLIADGNDIKNSSIETDIKNALHNYNPEKYPLEDIPHPEVDGVIIARPVGDWLDKIIDNFDKGKEFKDLPEDLVYDYQNAIQEQAIQRYYENPLYRWDLPDGTQVVGNSDSGFKYFDLAGYETPLGRDLNEVEVFLRQKGYTRTANNGSRLDDVQDIEKRPPPEYDNPDWRQPGGNKNYEEILLTGQRHDQTSMGEVERLGLIGIDEEMLGLGDWGNDYTGGHWGKKVPNVISSIRTTTRKDMRGYDVFFVEELQSDWHQRGRQVGYDNKEFRDNLEKRREHQQPIIENKIVDIDDELGELDTRRMRIRSKLKEDVKKLKDDLDINNVYYDDEAITFDLGQGREVEVDLVTKRVGRAGRDVTLDEVEKYSKIAQPYMDRVDEMNALWNKRVELDNQKITLQDTLNDILNPKAVPDAPFKDKRWIENTVNRAIQTGLERGHNKIAFPNREQILDIWNRERRKNANGEIEFYEMYDNLYNKNIPSMLKKLETKYGGKFKKETMDFGGEKQEVNVFEITPEYKKNVKEQGIPLASTGGLLSIDQMQDDDKMNNKQGLLA